MLLLFMWPSKHYYLMKLHWIWIEPKIKSAQSMNAPTKPINVYLPI